LGLVANPKPTRSKAIAQIIDRKADEISGLEHKQPKGTYQFNEIDAVQYARTPPHLARLPPGANLNLPRSVLLMPADFMDNGAAWKP
jgi:hypothetical protein